MTTTAEPDATSSARAGQRAVRVTDRQETGLRLLASSAKKSFDPAVEVDWAAEVPEHLFGMSPEWSTLYGTALWDELSHTQQVTLTKHEVSSIQGTGIWFEMILMQMVLRDMYGRNPAEAHVQFALTEIADECRHSVMFARSAAKFGCPSYRPSRSVLELGRLFKTLAFGASAYGGILVAEEILDLMQRDWMRDERVQPITRTLSRIHVVEEARHMRFAREEIVRRVQRLSAVQRATERASLAGAAYFITSSLVNPQVYAAAGVDVDRAVAAARANEHYKAKLRAGAAKLMAFLAEADLVGGPSKLAYSRVNLR